MEIGGAVGRPIDAAAERGDAVATGPLAGSMAAPDADFINGYFSDDLRAIAGAVGLGRALRLMFLLGGSTIYIPAAEELLRALRDERLRRMHASGRQVRELSRIYGLTPRTVYRILQAPPLGISRELECYIEKAMGRDTGREPGSGSAQE